MPRWIATESRGIGIATMLADVLTAAAEAPHAPIVHYCPVAVCALCGKAVRGDGATLPYIHAEV